MSLIKKTVVLTGTQGSGYMTTVKIGTTVGVKLNIKNPTIGSVAAIKLGDLATLSLPITGAVTEKEFYSLDFSDEAPVSVLVVYDGQVLLSGGIKGRIDLSDEVFGSKDDANEETVESTISQTEDTQTAESAQQATDDKFEFFKPQTTHGFYIGVQDKVEELLTVYPRDTDLERLLPESRAVRVDYGEGEFYVVGTLSDDGKVTHILYGVRGNQRVTPPKEVADVSQFLPLSSNNQDGYWIILQDADTGETIKND